LRIFPCSWKLVEEEQMQRLPNTFRHSFESMGCVAVLDTGLPTSSG
jgi:hypothetical protein